MPKFEYRVDFKVLDEVCLDCCDYISPKKGNPIKCVKCPIRILKDRFRKKGDTE